MWFLLKSIIGLAALLAGGYFVFFVDVGGKPVSAHLAEVWTSPVMQQKISLVKTEVQGSLERKLAEAEAPSRKKSGGAPGEEISEDDRRGLEALIAR